MKNPPGPVSPSSSRRSLGLRVVAAVALLGTGLAVGLVVASRARSEARREKERADRQHHLAAFLQAREHHRTGRYADALRTLQECPPAYRHWEWQWLERLLLPPSIRISCGAPPVALGAAPGGGVLAVTKQGFLRWDAELKRVEQFSRLPELNEGEEFRAAANSHGATAAISRGRTQLSVLYQAGMSGAGPPVSWNVPGRVTAVSAPARLGAVALVVQRDDSLWLELHSPGGRRRAARQLETFAWPTSVRLSGDGRRCLVLSSRLGSMNLPAPGSLYQLRGNQLVPVSLSIDPRDSLSDDGLDQADFGPGGMMAGAGLDWRIDFGGHDSRQSVPPPFAGPVARLEISPQGTWWAATDGATVSVLAIDPRQRLVQTVASFPAPGAGVVSLAVSEPPSVTRTGHGLRDGILWVGTADGLIQRHRLADLADAPAVEITGLTGQGLRGLYFEDGHLLRVVLARDARPDSFDPRWRRLAQTGWLRVETNGWALGGGVARVWPHLGQALLEDPAGDRANGGRLVRLTDGRESPVTAARRHEGWTLQCVSTDLRQAGLEREGRSAILDLSTGRLTPLPQNPDEQTCPLAVANQGDRILLRRTLGEVQQLVLAHLESRGNRLRYRNAVAVPGAHEAPAAHTFSRDGRRILVGGRQARLLDADSGLELLTLMDYGHPDGLEPGATVDWIEVSPDEKAVLCRTARYGMERLFRFSP